MKFVQKTHYLTQICWFTIIASGFESFWRKNLTLNFFGIFDLRFKSKSKVAGKNMKFVQKTHYLTQICWFTIIASGFESFWRKKIWLWIFSEFSIYDSSHYKSGLKLHYLTQKNIWNLFRKIWLWIFSEFSIYDSSQNLNLKFVQKTQICTQICWFTISGFESFCWSTIQVKI